MAAFVRLKISPQANQFVIVNLDHVRKIQQTGENQCMINLSDIETPLTVSHTLDELRTLFAKEKPKDSWFLPA
jgi:DNA-binding LytR/AlgR family response regulator